MNKSRIMLLGILIICMILFVIVTKSSSSIASSGNELPIKQAKPENRTIIKQYTSSLEVISGLTEKIELHATYYFEELCVETNTYIKEGTNLIKYTNGTYLVAPYDLIVKSYSLPDKKEMCTYSHYIETQAIYTLGSTISVNELDMEYISIGSEVEIIVNAFEKERYKGYVTAISEIATGSKFAVTITFINDGDVKLGMSGTCTFIFQEAKDVITVPVESIIKKDNKKCVTLINNNGETREVEVEIGLSDANYVEIKSGIEINDTLIY